MGRKNDLGRSLIKDKYKGRRSRNSGSTLHTTTLDDGYDWNKLNLKSVTENSHLEDFLATAELAGTEFTAEKLNIKFVSSKANVGVLTDEQKAKVTAAQQQNSKLLRIPRRPDWDSSTTPESLTELEKLSFLNWRRELAELQEVEHIVLTPYEKNLEFWRQLWRVVERSDVVAQIVDARNPLLFRCEDLEHYAREVGKDKLNLLILNKADFLTESQRKTWSDYFEKLNVRAVFYSALEQSQDSVDSETNKNSENSRHNLLNREELLKLFGSIHKGSKVRDEYVTIGLVGYPNVGKSSTINSLLQCKKVSVSTTPGKTKHFQTIFVSPDVCLCDCPGLVMPSFVNTKGDMVIWGILPIDQMRDHIPPVNLVSSLIPRHVLESRYGISLPKPMEGEDPERSPYAEELLNSYGFMRGFMTQRGLPDNARSSRYILKDFVNGKLLYCQAPPNVPQETFHQFEVSERVPPPATALQARILKAPVATVEDVDKEFFNKVTIEAHSKGKLGVYGYGRTEQPTPSNTKKPWKDHKSKRNKKQKLRKVYKHLDE